MSNKIKHFLDEVCIHIAYKSVHKEIRDELYEHLLALIESYKSEGLDEEDAVDKAIAQMGASEEIGRRLDKEHRPQIEWVLIALTAVIALVGGMLMFSSSKFAGGVAVNFTKYMAFSLIGIGGMAAMYFCDYTTLKKAAWPCCLLAFILLFITFKFDMSNEFGRRTLMIGKISVSNDYLILLFLIAFAGFLERNRGQGIAGIFKLFLFGMFSICAFTLIPNFSGALIMMITYAAALFTAVIKNHFGGSKRAQLLSLGVTGGSIAAFVIFSLLSSPYRLERVMSFLSRGKQDPMGAGFQQVLADSWLMMSNWLGKTQATYYGYSLDKIMPGSTTDFVLVNVIATLGWAVGIALVAIVLLFILRMLLTVRKVKNEYGFYLSLCACVILSAEFIISILLNFNLFPPMSMSMPFISYGGTGYIVNMLLVGIILSVWRRNNVISRETMPVHGQNPVRLEDGRLIITYKGKKI